MTRWKRPAALLLLVVVSTLPVAADPAVSWFKKGQDAEARQNYERAYDDYKQAYDLKPKDLRYRASFERLRFLAGASHVHRGQLLREAGKLDEALAEFQKAAEIDSSSFIARQEIRETQKMIEQAKAPGPHSEVLPPDGLQKRLAQAQGPVELASIPNVPMTMMSTQDSKKIYETWGELAGVNVLFDPDYTSRVIPVHLNNISLPQALEAIELESNTFFRVVTPNTIFVAQDNPSKRKQVEQNVVKTFFLANLSQPTELQDVSNTLRQILEITKIQPLPSQNAIVVRGTPDQIAMAEKLVNDFDKARPEVVIDVAILQVSRDKAHTLGISPPTSATIALQNNLTTSTTSSSTTTAATNTTGTPNQVNFNRIGNLNATDFTVTIPSASATALFSDSDTKLIQNPQIRSIDGQKATLKIGEKIPIATGSFQPGIGGVGINPLVNTQFQYTDVGVVIEITPTIHPDGDVSMHLSMQISSVTGQSSIGGITQPIIGQKTDEGTIRLRDGEVSLLGGMFDDQSTRSVSGIPGLGSIPILKYLFSQVQTDHSQDEVVFVLIPHIVRKIEQDAMSNKEISVGTASGIQLSHTAPLTLPQTPSAPASPAAPQAQMAAPIAQQPPAQGVPAPTAPATQTASPVPASFNFDPPNVTAKAGSTFAVNILLNGAQNVHSVPLQVSYDPKLLQVVNISNGGFLSQDGQAVPIVHRDDDAGGTLQIDATRPPGTNGVSGQGAVITLTFMAKTSGQGTLVISKGGARDPAMQAIPVAGTTATVTVQ
jgi:general secretion pathway protein D